MLRICDLPGGCKRVPRVTLIHTLLRVRVRACVFPPLTAVAAVPVEAVVPAREYRGALGGTACGPRRVGGTPGPRPRMCGACAGERRKFDSIGVGVTGTPRPWPVVRHGCAGRARGSTASSTRSTRASPARRVRGPFQATDARGVPGERRTIDSIEATTNTSATDIRD